MLAHLSADPRGPVTTSGCDVGAIVLGWLARVSGLLTVLGLIVFDLASVATTHLALKEDATVVASAASVAWAETRNPDQTFAAALQAAVASDPSNVVEPATFSVGQDGSVRVRVSRRADTLVSVHVPWLQDATRLSAESTVSAPQ